jgi:hypothetical protein
LSHRRPPRPLPKHVRAPFRGAAVLGDER